MPLLFAALGAGLGAIAVAAVAGHALIVAFCAAALAVWMLTVAAGSFRRRG